MNEIEGLISGYREFRRERYPHQRALFSRLAHGQNPRVMVIACADSRADPSVIFSAAPGELFVVRNVANIVPPYEEQGQFHGTAAALEFAITGLGVHDILVMGHAKCGGIAACLNPGSDGTRGRFIGPWVALLDHLRRSIKAQSVNLNADQLQLAMEQAAVGQSLVNIATYPFAVNAIESGQLRLHGAWFSIATGELHWREALTGRFSPVSADAPAAEAKPAG